MVMDYQNLLVIVVVAHLNLKKFDVRWFERGLEIEFCEIKEMRCCLCYIIIVTVVNSR